MFLHFRSWNTLSTPGYLPVSRRRPDVTDVTEADGDEAADGRAAMLVYDRVISLETPAYFVELNIEGDLVISIRDFLFARYAMDSVTLYLLPTITKLVGR
jgi:hypothetical protein